MCGMCESCVRVWYVCLCAFLRACVCLCVCVRACVRWRVYYCIVHLRRGRFVFSSFFLLITGTSLSNDDGHTLVATTPISIPHKYSQIIVQLDFYRKNTKHERKVCYIVGGGGGGGLNKLF